MIAVLWSLNQRNYKELCSWLYYWFRGIYITAIDYHCRFDATGEYFFSYRESGDELRHSHFPHFAEFWRHYELSSGTQLREWSRMTLRRLIPIFILSPFPRSDYNKICDYNNAAFGFATQHATILENIGQIRMRYKNIHVILLQI